ncbi:GtrA family protein [Pelomonas sp. CA6]|uniref:GtrA family protein n=1 Tax=Pelomonas sp. CA6 TaxID=2907999 RepID=UPI001F4C1095|nr:GtrA family protein [Pelomonas sp. CA6]MCH7345123.1 GtrA family protein [Pelomonas sp. CA6]
MFTRYFMTSVLATLVHYMVLALLAGVAGWTSGPAAAMGAAIGGVVALWGNWHYTFVERRRESTLRRVATRFTTVVLLSALLQGLMVQGFCSQLGLSVLPAQLLTTLLLFLLGYGLNLRWSFA